MSICPKLRKLCLLLPIVGIVACIGIRPPSVSVSVDTPLPSITVENLWALLQSDSTALVLDVRTPEEFEGPLGHIDEALLIPVQELEARLGELSQYRDQEIYVVCRVGGRSSRATRLLLEADLKATNVEGGMEAWNRMNANVKGQDN